MAKEEVKVVVKGIVNSVNGKTGDVIVEVPEVDLTDYYTKDETNELIDKVSAGDIDLTNYFTKEETESLIDDAIDSIVIPETDLSNYYTKSEVDKKIDDIEIPNVDLSDYYTKDEVYTKEETNALIDGISGGDTDLTNYYTKNQTDGLIDDLVSDINEKHYTKTEVDTAISTVKTTIPTKTSDILNDSNFITNNTTELSNYYNKTEVNDLISSVNGVQLEVVDTLPTADIKTNAIYLVPKISGEEQNIYNEYVYLNNAWELIGSTAVDLSNFYTKQQVDAKVPNIVHLSQEEYDALTTKEENTYYFIVEA